MPVPVRWSSLADRPSYRSLACAGTNRQGSDSTGDGRLPAYRGQPTVSVSFRVALRRFTQAVVASHSQQDDAEDGERPADDGERDDLV